MKQTAVEWLAEKYDYAYWMVKRNEISPVLAEQWKKHYLEQAKEMDKQQKEDFFNAGVRYGSGSVMANEWGEDTEEYNFEQYYNETFKSEQNESNNKQIYNEMFEAFI